MKKFLYTLTIALTVISLPGCKTTNQSSENTDNNQAMKTLIIKDLDKSASEKMELTDIVNVLDKEKIDYQPIDIVNWKAFPYQPQVSFRIAWSSETSEIKALFLIRTTVWNFSFRRVRIPAITIWNSTV